MIKKLKFFWDVLCLSMFIFYPSMLIPKAYYGVLTNIDITILMFILVCFCLTEFAENLVKFLKKRWKI